MTDTEKEIAVLARMPRHELRVRWSRPYNTEPPAHISQRLMARTLAYRLQEREYGGLDKNTKRRLRSLARALESEGELPLTSDL